MTLVTLKSSAISQVEYQEKEKTLSVYFTDATNSTYHGVPKELNQGLLKAKSAGGFFNDKIRDHYKSS